MRRAIITAAAVAAAAALVPGAAHAAPARTTDLAAAGATYMWDGAALNGAAATAEINDAVPCTPGIDECDDTLIKVDVAGSLNVKIGSGSAGAVDLDLYLYASDASGAAGKAVKSSTGGTADETITADVDPGYYLARVVASTAVQGSYKGSATLAAPTADPGDVNAPVNPTTTPTTTPAPAATNAAPVTTITKPKGKKIKVLKGKAADANGIKGVKAGLTLVRGKTCFGLTAKGTFKRLKKCGAPTLLTAKGTTAWSLKLKKPLKKGTYVAYAIATDKLGLAEGGFGKKNKVTFTVR